ncbi:MAG: CheR family methyltransferase [Syntrophaceticus sp.]
MELSTREFHLIKDLVKNKFGIYLREQKKSLVVQRLQKELWAGGFSSFQDYYNYVIKDASGQALNKMGDLISTNHTYFFREEVHFEFIERVALPQLINAVRKKEEREIRVWCAGCSSGEEAYSLAMVLSQYAEEHNPGVQFYILATDISDRVLKKAVASIYSKEQVMRVPPLYRMRYFDQLGDGRWKVRPNIRKMILFRRLNLMRQEYPFKRRFQIIMCRNVMIYFDEPTKNQITKRFYRYMEEGGYLLIGHSETLDRSLGLYRFIQPAVFQRL